MSTEQTVGESKVWINDVLYMAPDPVATEIEHLQTENEKLKATWAEISLCAHSSELTLASENAKLRKHQKLLEKVVEALDIFQSLLDKGYEGWPIGGPEHSGDWEEQRQLRLARAALKGQSGVMDRLVASDEAIAEAEQAQGYAAIYATAEEMGVSQEVFEVYQANVTKAHQKTL